VSIEHATADGEVKLSASPTRLQIDGQVRGLDLVVDDFKGGANGVTADMGRTHVSGSARFSVGAAGVQADGRLRAQATIDSATFSQTGRSASLGSSTVSGELTKLHLGKDAPVLTLEKAQASLNLKRAALEIGSATVRGGGRLKGSGTVVLDASGLSLDGASQGVDGADRRARAQLDRRPHHGQRRRRHARAEGPAPGPGDGNYGG
jgi:hypothetical protein